MSSRSITFYTRPAGLSLAICLAALVSFPSAASAGRSEQDVAPAMPLGGAAAPPLGFIEYCSRTPSDCPDAPGTQTDLPALRAAAMQAFWERAFAAPPSVTHVNAPAALGRDTGSTRFDWSTVFSGRSTHPVMLETAAGRTVLARRTAGEQVDTVSTVVAADAVGEGGPAASAAETPLGAHEEAFALAWQDAGAAADFVTLSQPQPIASPDPKLSEEKEKVSEPAAFSLDRSGWRLVNSVNRRINREIRRASDERTYNMADYWAAPSGDGARGDCEDYVLAKRRALIDAGVPASSLSIAIVDTTWGESHAVLLILAEQGEFVLDSLTPWVSRWDRVNYVWRERQLPGRTFDWVRADI